MGRTKGLLVAPPARQGSAGEPRGDSSCSSAPSGNLGSREGETIVERTFRIVQSALPAVPVVLVGDRDEFDELPLERVRDAQPNAGPLGGLVGLLRVAKDRGASHVIALGSDFPYLTESLLTRLATVEPSAPLLAPFLDDRYQPLVARYAAGILEQFEACLSSGRYGLQGPLRELGAARLALGSTDPEALTDWDTPEDVLRGRARPS